MHFPRSGGKITKYAGWIHKSAFNTPPFQNILYSYTSVFFFMTRTFARSLSRKKIMSNDGKLIGVLKNLRVDFDSGQVLELIVHPDQSFVTDGYQLEDGNLLVVPFEAVKDIKDYIVVDRYLARR